MQVVIYSTEILKLNLIGITDPLCFQGDKELKWNLRGKLF